MTRSPPTRQSTRAWFLRGARHVVSIPAAVLVAAQIGFTALAREAGFDVFQTMFLTITVWALPAQVVFVGVVAAGATLPAVIVAVGLSSVRFMPMVMSWTPVVRAPSTSRLTLLAASWFVAVTAWVFAMSRLPQLDREVRLAFFAGFAATLTLTNVVVVGLSHTLIGALPPVLAGALVFLTPIYFITALWGAARLNADRLALGFGLVLGPIATWIVPELDLLAAGLVGGTLAYITARLLERQT